MKRSAYLLLSLVLVLVWTTRAGAAPNLTEPKGNPVHVVLDSRGVPVPFTVAVAGFPAGSLVYVEQCDGQPPTAPGWGPTTDCDIGSSPAPVIVDSNGRAQFTAGDRNHGFQPFVGQGPEGLFSCLRLDGSTPKSGLPEYRNCQIRVSSSNNQTTADQVMVPIVLGGAATSSSSSGLSPALIVVIVVVIVAAIVVGLVLVRRRSQRVS